MTRNYLSILADTIRTNWDQPALTDFYLTEDGTAQDTTRGNCYTYGEMYTEVCRVADRLTSLGLQKGDHIAICGANSANWVIAYLAIAKMQGVSVTVMHTLMPDEIVRLVNFSDAKALFTDPDIWFDLSPIALGEGQGVRCVLSLADWSLLDSCSDRAMSVKRERRTAECPVDSQGVSAPREFAERIQNSLKPRQPREDREITFPSFAPDDLAMICFTSGTSGKAKGVMLPFRSINANVAIKFSDFIKSKGRTSLSWLPMGHIYGLLAEILQPMCIGISVVVYKSDINTSFVHMVQMVKPAILMTVPIVLEKIVTSIKQYTSDVPTIRKQLLNILGNNLDLIGVGGALLSTELEEILYAHPIPLGMSYGMTECGPRIALALSTELRPHTVGKILPSLTARISPVGEILVKGENVMLGYYKDPEATAAKIDSDGWLHTGDKGHLDEDGYLYVEGRLEQDIIVLPNGENIRPDNIESLINALPEVKESIVLARDGKLVALIVPSSPLALGEGKGVRLSILRTVNPQLPLFSQLYDVEITDQPLARTEKQTIKRYLYK